jgi:formylglycine-generating enzyme required for sulfatase activity
MEKVARAVQHAHEHGILHRDLKPGNILLDERGEPLVSDFGLAKILDSEDDLTHTGAVLGTPAYMPPEQAGAGKWPLGAAGDVWSIGVMLYELLGGRRPFEAPGSRERLLHQIRSSEPPRLRSLQRAIDPALESIVMKCLEKDPAQRYATAGTLADDLARWLAGEPVQARPIRLSQHWMRWARRHPWQLATGALLALFLALLIWGIAADRGKPSGAPVGPVTRLNSTPEGARVVLVPLDEWDDLQPDRAIRPDQRTPLTLSGIPPGKYLVVAEVPGHGFHEVYRTVPGPDDKSGLRAFENWTRADDGSVALADIIVPANLRRDANAAPDMAYFPGGQFPMGMPNAPDPKNNLLVDIVTPVHEQTVLPFFLDTTEVTVAAYRKTTGDIPERLQQLHKNPPADFDSWPVTFVSYLQALEFAERAGKRLMTEAEYEFACRSLPWRDLPRQFGPGDWRISPVRLPAWDRTNTEPPVHGLFSNAVEWTDSHLAHYKPELHPGKMKGIDGGRYVSAYKNSRAVRGGPFGAATGQPIDPQQLTLGLYYRFMMPVDAMESGLGFRCARSARPRFLD